MHYERSLVLILEHLLKLESNSSQILVKADLWIVAVYPYQ